MIDGDYGGFFGGLLKELSRAMNFTISKIMWEEHSGLWFPQNCTGAGVFGRVYRQEADLGIAAIFMTSDRDQIISFTSPVEIGPLQLHFRKHDDAHLAWNAHFKVLINYNHPLYSFSSVSMSTILTIDSSMIAVCRGCVDGYYRFDFDSAYFINSHQIQKKISFLFPPFGTPSICLGNLLCSKSAR